MKTIWGKAQDINKLAEGILFISTARHGGYKLDSKRNAMVPEQWRYPGGWYEEDCGWAAVAKTFPDVFPPEAQEHANWVIPSWEKWVARSR